MIAKESFFKLIEDHQSAHSDLQMDRFILLANGLTDYGCYKQALRELHTRFHSMLGYWLELETLNCDEDDIAEKEFASDRRRQLELAKLRLRRMSLEESYSESRREFLRFLGHAIALKEKVGELTPAKRKQLETDFWIQNIKRMGPEKGMRLAQTLPHEDRLRIMDGDPQPYPELPEPKLDFDVEEMLRLTVQEKLLCGPAQS